MFRFFALGAALFKVRLERNLSKTQKAKMRKAVAANRARFEKKLGRPLILVKKNLGHFVASFLWNLLGLGYYGMSMDEFD